MGFKSDKQVNEAEGGILPIAIASSALTDVDQPWKLERAKKLAKQVQI